MKKETNYYKIATFVLLGVAVLFLGSYVLTSMAQNEFQKGVEFGQVNAVNLIVGTVGQEGFVTINLPEGNVTLVPAASVGLGQQQLMNTLLTTIQEQGSVKVSTQDGQEISLGFVNNK